MIKIATQETKPATRISATRILQGLQPRSLKGAAAFVAMSTALTYNGIAYWTDQPVPAVQLVTEFAGKTGAGLGGLRTHTLNTIAEQGPLAVLKLPSDVVHFTAQQFLGVIYEDPTVAVGFLATVAYGVDKLRALHNENKRLNKELRRIAGNALTDSLDINYNRATFTETGEPIRSITKEEASLIDLQGRPDDIVRAIHKGETPAGMSNPSGKLVDMVITNPGESFTIDDVLRKAFGNNMEDRAYMVNMIQKAKIFAIRNKESSATNCANITKILFELLIKDQKARAIIEGAPQNYPGGIDAAVDSGELDKLAAKQTVSMEEGSEPIESAIGYMSAFMISINRIAGEQFAGEFNYDDDKDFGAAFPILILDLYHKDAKTAGLRLNLVKKDEAIPHARDIRVDGVTVVDAIARAVEGTDSRVPFRLDKSVQMAALKTDLEADDAFGRYMRDGFGPDRGSKEVVLHKPKHQLADRVIALEGKIAGLGNTRPSPLHERIRRARPGGPLNRAIK